MRDSGFTLLEIVVTLAILSLVTVVISSSIMLGVKASEIGEANIDALQGLRTIITMFSSELKSVYPYKIDNNGKNVYLFKGGRDSVLFACAVDYPSANAIKWVSYYMENRKLKIAKGMLPDKKLLDKTERFGEVVDCGIDKISFEYLSDEDVWNTEWLLTDSLPKAVSIKINETENIKIFIPVWTKKEKTGKDTKLPELEIKK
ncbi:MAG: prepilin-type N-terminal cleavage/methylation domain-containing protein [Nitrospirae bacterium]|nr:prepilin-type N-terminal cleavage/methylation domain-containing protein [Nitrospirota bacterium]